MRKTISEDYEIRYGDTFSSIFGENDGGSGRQRNHEELKDNPVYQRFQAKFKEIFSIGNYKNVDPGETIGLIVEQLGLFLDHIKWGRLDEVKDFVRDNIDERYKWLAPELHEYLLKTGYYSKSSTAVAREKRNCVREKARLKMRVNRCVSRVRRVNNF